MSRPTADVVVAGAGISGLSTAFWLTRAGLRVTILEASSDVGGAMETWCPDAPGGEETGWVFEQGPNTVLESPEAREALGELLRDSGLGDDRLEAATEAARRWVYHDGELHLLPTSPPKILRTSLLSPAAKMRLLREPFVGRGPQDREETVAELVRRRLGPEILERAVGPFVSGVWAGDPDRLSAMWAMPRLVAMERHHGSLLKAALARKEDGEGRPPIVSVEGGFGRLATRLEEVVGDVRRGAPVTAVEPLAVGSEETGGGFRVRFGGDAPGALTARHVILAVPADAAAAILADASGGRSGLFTDLTYAPVAVVSLGYPQRAVDHPLDGFGFLVPREEGLDVLGCLFASSIFPRRAPAGHVGLTAFLGGRTAPKVVELAEDEIRDRTIRDLDRVLGLSGDPRVEHVRRWPRALPQYEIGHGRFVQRAAELERDLPGLHFAVNWLDGPSVADCVKRAREVACEVLREHPEGEAEPIC